MKILRLSQDLVLFVDYQLFWAADDRSERSSGLTDHLRLKISLNSLIYFGFHVKLIWPCLLNTINASPVLLECFSLYEWLILICCLYRSEKSQPTLLFLQEIDKQVVEIMNPFNVWTFFHSNTLAIYLSML